HQPLPAGGGPRLPGALTLASGRSRVRQHPPLRRNGHEASIPAFKHPAFFMQHPVMAAADEGQVGQCGLAATRPPDQVVAIAPDRWPMTAVEDASVIAGDQRPAGGGRYLPMWVAGFLGLPLC